MSSRISSQEHSYTTVLTRATLPFMHIVGSSHISLSLTELLEATFHPTKVFGGVQLANLQGSVVVDCSFYEQPLDVVKITGRALVSSLYGIKYILLAQDDVDGMTNAARNAVLRMNPSALVMCVGTQIVQPGRAIDITPGSKHESLVHIDDLASLVRKYQEWSGWLTAGPPETTHFHTMMVWNQSQRYKPQLSGMVLSNMVTTDHPDDLFLRMKQ